MSILILVLICVLLVIRQYSWPFVQKGLFPYSGAFALFSVFIIILGLINGIYLFGVLPGIIFCFLLSFNILLLCFLWPFTLLLYVVFYKHPQEGVYALFPIGTWMLCIFTVINFFVSPYRVLGGWITADVVKYLIIVGLISLVVGQIIIKVTLAMIQKEMMFK